MNNDIQNYYRDNPLMVSSPFGGVDGMREDLLADVFDRLNVSIDNRWLLDVGCGRAFLADMVARANGFYMGIDIVTCHAQRDDRHVLQAAADALPFPRGSFDIVTCIDAFEHFERPGAAAREFRRVLHDDGCVFLSAPNYGNVAGLVKKACETFGSYRRDTWAPFRNWQPQEHEAFLTSSGLRRTFRAAGFRKLRRIGYGGEVGVGLFPWLEHRRMPEWAGFRLQRLFGNMGEAVVSVWPGASLHNFWKIEV